MCGWRVNVWRVGGCGWLWVGERVGSVMAQVGVGWCVMGCAGLDCEWVGVGWYWLVWVLLAVVRDGLVQCAVGCVGGEVGSVVRVVAMVGSVGVVSLV